MSKTWWFVSGDKALELQSALEVEEFERLAALVGERSVTWVDIVQAPLRYGSVVRPLAELCAAKCGVSLPEKMTPVVVLEMFDLRDDTVPAQFTDGMPSDPKEDSPTTD